MMKNFSELKQLGWKLAVGVLALAAAPTMVGCSHKDAAAEDSKPLGKSGDEFIAEDEPRDLNRMINAAAASGARKDATLHACHFDGGNPGALNSLGEQKLDLMLVDDDALPLVIYLDVPSDDAYPIREQAVRVFLKDRGLNEAQVKLVAGQNTRNMAQVSPLLKAAASADAAPPPAGGGSSLSPK